MANRVDNRLGFFLLIFFEKNIFKRLNLLGVT